MILKYFTIILCSIVVISCDRGSHMPEKASEPIAGEEPSKPNPASQDQASSGPTYEDDIQPIFNKYCSGCHKTGSGLPNWNNYNEAFAKKDRIFERTIVQKTMPPPGTPRPQPAELTKLAQWLTGNAPQKTVVIAKAQAPVPVQALSQPQPASIETAEASIPVLYCEQIQKYANQNIKSNRSLTATLSKDIKNLKIEFINLTFDSQERISTVESISLFKPTSQGVEICETYISDINDCEITSIVESPNTADIAIVCDLQNPIRFEFSLENGQAIATCESDNLNFSSQFRNCRMR